MGIDEKILAYMNRVRHLAAILKLINVNVDEKELVIAVLSILLKSYKTLIATMDVLGSNDMSFSYDLVNSRLLQEEKRMNMRSIGSDSSVLLSFNDSDEKNPGRGEGIQRF